MLTANLFLFSILHPVSVFWYIPFFIILSFNWKEEEEGKGLKGERERKDKNEKGKGKKLRGNRKRTKKQQADSVQIIEKIK